MSRTSSKIRKKRCESKKKALPGCALEVFLTLAKARGVTQCTIWGKNFQQTTPTEKKKLPTLDRVQVRKKT